MSWCLVRPGILAVQPAGIPHFNSKLEIEAHMRDLVSLLLSCDLHPSWNCPVKKSSFQCWVLGEGNRK